MNSYYSKNHHRRHTFPLDAPDQTERYSPKMRRTIYGDLLVQLSVNGPERGCVIQSKHDSELCVKHEQYKIHVSVFSYSSREN